MQPHARCISFMYVLLKLVFQFQHTRCPLLIDTTHRLAPGRWWTVDSRSSGKTRSSALSSSCNVDASCSPKHREVRRGREERKPTQTEGSWLFGGASAPEKHKGKRTRGTRLLPKQTGPDGLCMRQPAELAKPAAQQFTASSQNLQEEAWRSRQEYREKKGLLKNLLSGKSDD